MHKKTAKRSTLHSLTHKVKAPENLPRLRDYEGNEGESSDHFQLPSLQKKKIWKDTDDRVSTLDESIATCLSYSTEMEGITTAKVLEQWEAIENTLYEDGEQVTNTVLLEECIQWRTQIPHLRVVGKNPFLSLKSRYEDVDRNSSETKSSFDSHDEELLLGHGGSMKERKGSSSKHKLQTTPQEKIFDILSEYIMSELLPNKENEIESLGDDLSEVLQIRRASVHSSRSSAKSTKLHWYEETIPLDKRFPSSRSRAMESHGVPMIRDSAHTSVQESHRKYDNFKDNDRIKNGRDATSAIEDKLFRPHTGRNKLGTVFNEKIVVSPVPYILSTKESFSTVKTTPIKYMGQPLSVSTFQGKYSTPVKISNYQSAWHAAVSPAVWPKNIKLAPLDTSRLPSSKNRSSTPSSVMLQRNRKPLSPISRSTLPVSAQSSHDNNEALEIQGRHIIPGQSSKLSLSNTNWDYNAGSSTARKKRSQLKTKL
ncbi:uncharacterized protein LOC143369565 isoform X1 [Andrena cerasifolii]|uniref:uncharacterized protein LOC143369565 isoform X1 n=2 Tax=Andrena cerasifolii TaxID=2819439 RepID=UPI0040381096